MLWKAKHGAHPAIVANIHDLIADIAWELQNDQIEHMFQLILSTWIEPESQAKGFISRNSSLNQIFYC